MREINLVTYLHKKTKRNYVKRMLNDKIICMKEAKNIRRIIGMEIENMDMVDTNIFQEDGNL